MLFIATGRQAVPAQAWVRPPNCTTLALNFLPTFLVVTLLNKVVTVHEVHLYGPFTVSGLTLPLRQRIRPFTTNNALSRSQLHRDRAILAHALPGLGVNRWSPQALKASIKQKATSKRNLNDKLKVSNTEIFKFSYTRKLHRSICYRSRLLINNKFGEITQSKGHYTVQGHSKSPILIPIESSYTINQSINQNLFSEQ